MFDDIFKKRNDKNPQLVERDDHFVLFNVNKIEKKIPKLENEKFLKQINTNLILNEKYEYNKKLLEKIQKNDFTEIDFYSISKSSKINKSIIESISDTRNFDLNSVKLIYSIGKNSFVMTSDDKNNVFIVKINNINLPLLKKNSKIHKEYSKKIGNDIKDSIYVSYDYLINNNYKIKINQNTMERVKNYFK